MVDLIALAVIAAVIGLAAGYVYKAKKRGVRCVGCPNGGNCGSCPGCHQK